MRGLSLVAFTFAVGLVHAEVLFDQMTNPVNSIYASSWVPPDGTDSDSYRYDNFLIPVKSTITGVRWIGGGGSPTKFTVRFYQGLPGYPDYQPLISALPSEEKAANYLVGYSFNGNANQTATSTPGLFEYNVTIANGLKLSPNTVYWIKIEADVAGYPGWGLARASHGRDSRHFCYITGLHMFQAYSSSLAFQLTGTSVSDPGTRIRSVFRPN